MKKTLFELWLTAKRAHNPVLVRLAALLLMILIGSLAVLFIPVWILARSEGHGEEEFFKDNEDYWSWKDSPLGKHDPL